MISKVQAPSSALHRFAVEVATTLDNCNIRKAGGFFHFAVKNMRRDATRPLISAYVSGKTYVPRNPPREHIPQSPRIATLLSTPTWSVKSLFPETDTTPVPADSISSEKLRHLLRLSALPPPKNAAEEARLLKTLHAQIHFVKEIQKVDTRGVEPLRAIRDETAEAAEEDTIRLEGLQGFLDQEEKIGRNGRVRRKEEEGDTGRKWDPFAMSPSDPKNKGKYFVVRRQKKENKERSSTELDNLFP